MKKRTKKLLAVSVLALLLAGGAIVIRPFGDPPYATGIMPIGDPPYALIHLLGL